MIVPVATRPYVRPAFEVRQPSTEHELNFTALHNYAYLHNTSRTHSSQSVRKKALAHISPLQLPASLIDAELASRWYVVLPAVSASSAFN